MSRRFLKRQRMRNIIIEAAHESFGNKPYDAVNMDEIAEKALLSRATLYNYFDNKETLYFEVGLEGWVKTGKLLPAFIETESKGIEKIMKLIPEGFYGVLQSPLYYNILRRFMEKNIEAEQLIEETYFNMTKEQLESLDPSSETVLLRYYHELQKYGENFLHAIEVGQKDGSIRKDLPAKHLNFLNNMYINGMLNQITLQHETLKHLGFNIDDVIKTLTENLRKTLEP